MICSYEDLNRQLNELRCSLEKALAKNQELLVENQALKEKVKDLEEKLNTNSTNSSVPPSQDPFRKMRRKNPSGRPKGGQSCHKGHARQLVPPEQVQTFHELRPTSCPNCASSVFDDVPIRTEVRQVIELPEAPPLTTQYNIHTCCCGKCGKYVRADIPDEARYGFGPRLMGLVTSLTGEFRLSKRQVVALLGKINIRVCSGSVCKIHDRARELLNVVYEEIRARALRQDRLNGDESSWKTSGKKKWIWIAVGHDSVVFKIMASRSSQAFHEVFGGFKGTLSTDRYAGYNTHEGPRQLCWSHANRDFEKIAERGEIDAWIGNRLKESSKEMFHSWTLFKNGEIDRKELISRVENGAKKRTESLLKLGGIHQKCHRKTRATCLNFFERFSCLWIFLYQEGVEPTNNAAERGLRHAVIWRKLSYGSQSEKGERFVERVMTVAQTLKMRSKNSLEYFTTCFRALVHGAQPPPLPD
jgi:transposase